MDWDKKILIVDDEPEYRALVDKGLRAAGYHTVLAQDGGEALKVLWEKDGIGLVLLDVRLPRMNGMDIFEIIRRDFPDKKIIICSALRKEEQRFFIYNADDYYYKFEDPDILIKKIEKVFSGKNREGAVREKEKNERRSFRRMPVNVLATCENMSPGTSPSGAHFLSYIKDLSLRGGRFVINEDPKVGRHFSAALELPVNSFPLLVDCEVVWVKKLEEPGPRPKRNFEAGVRFVKLDLSRDEEKLKNYLSLFKTAAVFK